jgi:hypothetical protein
MLSSLYNGAKDCKRNQRIMGSISRHSLEWNAEGEKKSDDQGSEGYDRY